MDDTENSPEELVLTLIEDENGTVEASKEKAIALAPGNLRKRESESIWSASFDGGSVVAWRLVDVSPAEVSYRHFFDLRNYRQICSVGRRFPTN